MPYEWGGPLPPELSAPFDVILLSDLIYETESLQPLIDTLAGFLDRHESSSGGGGGGATSNGGPAASPAGSGGGGGQQQRGVTALVSAELRTDTGIAQFVRTLVSRGYYVERVRYGAACSWRLRAWLCVCVAPAAFGALAGPLPAAVRAGGLLHLPAACTLEINS